jgi:uncharacterized damage-inducible protein DinB
MPTVQELAVKLNRDAAASLVRNVRAMPDDKAAWQPLEKGRTALSQLQECAVICGFTIDTLKTHAIAPDFHEAFGRESAQIDTVDKAVARLEERSAALAAAIQAFPDADLDIPVKLPWQEEPASLAELMFMNFWNTVYHVGQVSYIQTLYGDNDMH